MSYVYLAIAIICEPFGTTCMKYSDGFGKLLPSLLTLLFYGVCYVFFAKSLQTINLSIAYATWCGVGIVAATLLSILIFKETISFMGIVGICLVLAGVIILNTVGATH